MKLVYISGRITGLSEIQWKFNFNRAESCLKRRGYNVVNPIKIPPSNIGNNWQKYMRTDIIELCKCTHIYMQRNWWRSKGAVTELIIAKVLGIKVLWEGII